MMIKGTQQENSHKDTPRPDSTAPKYKRLPLKELKGAADNSAIAAGPLNNPRVIMDRSSRRKINKRTQG